MTDIHFLLDIEDKLNSFWEPTNQDGSACELFKFFETGLEKYVPIVLA